MQRFGNLKVGSVFVFFLSQNRGFDIGFQKKKKGFVFWKLTIEIAVSVFDFGLEAKTECLGLLLRSMTTSYYVVVDTNTMLQIKIKKIAWLKNQEGKTN